jgi:hypothetical protein
VTFSGLLTKDVTILTPTTEANRYGGTDKRWDNATETTVKGWVSQTSRLEVTDGREAQVASWVLFVDPDTTVTGKDRVEWEGITFEVDGPPNPVHRPGGLHHYEVPLRVVVG